MAAANYKLLGSSRGVQQRTPTTAEDVEILEVATKPSGVKFVRNVPYASFKDGKWRADVTAIAGHIEHILASRPHVVSGAPVELIDQQGLLTNAVDFLVSYTADDGAGPFQDDVVIPVQALHDDDSFDSYFDPVVKVLAAAAAAA